MGNFYVNFTVVSDNQAVVRKALTQRFAIITKPKNGRIAVFEEQSEQQSDEATTAVGNDLSKKLGCSVLSVLNHDDDILEVRLFTNGTVTFEYNSSPGYFSGEHAAPTIGDVDVLARAFGVSDSAAIRKVLESDQVFAFELHGKLAEQLNLPNETIGLGYNTVEEERPLIGAMRTLGGN